MTEKVRKLPEAASLRGRDVLKGAYGPRYLAILDWIVRRHADGLAPSVQETARQFNEKASTTHDRVKRFVAQELLTVERSNTSAVRLVPTPLGRARSGFELPPRVLAYRPDEEEEMPLFPISCGPLREATAEAEWVTTPFHDRREGDYLLEAVSDSMWDAEAARGLPVGAKMHMRPDEWPAWGEIVHAEYVRGDGAHDCTLKFFEPDEASGMVTLRALNPLYPDIVRPLDEVVLRGKMIDAVIPAWALLARPQTRK